jgi:hypothetical protein
MNYAFFFLCVAVLCIACPPLLGFVTGLGGFCFIWYCFYKLLGGSA